MAPGDCKFLACAIIRPNDNDDLMIYIYIYIYIHTHTHTHTYAHMSVCVYISSICRMREWCIEITEYEPETEAQYKKSLTDLIKITF